ncbi:MAG: Rieske (2Fe-2S) protein [Verrucomicrobia bacterium]|nr:Rieske (2Fe-2S) protein [Verrucomicrobiota bacterium]
MNAPAPANPEQPADDEVLDRRRFVALALGGVALCYAGAVGYPIFRFLTSPAERAAAAAAVNEVLLTDAHKLPLGSALIFKFGTRPALLIHHKDDTWIALDAVCTHLACTVQYQPDKDRIECACHGGEYDAHTGRNLAGPPPKPLKRFEVKLVPSGVQVLRT